MTEHSNLMPETLTSCHHVLALVGYNGGAECDLCGQMWDVDTMLAAAERGLNQNTRAAADRKRLEEARWIIENYGVYLPDLGEWMRRRNAWLAALAAGDGRLT